MMIAVDDRTDASPIQTKGNQSLQDSKRRVGARRLRLCYAVLECCWHLVDEFVEAGCPRNRNGASASTGARTQRSVSWSVALWVTVGEAPGVPVTDAA